MSDRAWDELLDIVDEKYQIDRHEKREEPLEDNPSMKRRIHGILFAKGGVSYKIERITSPAVKDTKSHYAHRGAANRVTHMYDSDETVSRAVFYRQVEDGSWMEVSPESLLA